VERIEKYSTVTVILLLTIGFLFRLYTAAIIPIVNADEQKEIAFAKGISFEPGNLNLPVGDREMKNPLLTSYVLKLGIFLFGESKLGGRLLFILLSTFSLFFIYKLVEENLGVKCALLSLCFLIFSQYHIGLIRIVDNGSLYFSFLPPTLYVFFKVLTSKEVKYVFLTVLLVGFGSLVYEGMALLYLVVVFYLFIDKKYRFWLKRKEFYLSFILLLIIVFPFLVWNYFNNFIKLEDEHFWDFGFSLRSFYLYFGELLAWFGQHSSLFSWNLSEEAIYLHRPGKEPAFLSGISNEFPIIHFPLAILIIIAYIYCLFHHKKNELIKFCLFIFGSVFLVTSIIAGSYTLLDDHWWADMTLFPGVVLCAYMLFDFQAKCRVIKFFIAAIIIYFFFHCVHFINLPESQFALPPDSLYQYYLNKAEEYLSNNEKHIAQNRCHWVLARAKNPAIIGRAKNILGRISDD